MNTITCITKERPVNRVFAPLELLQSVFAALNKRNIHRAIDQFADEFVFRDNALDLEFTDKERLTKFFQKSLELFPDTVVELVSIFECDDHAIAEWKLTTTHTEAFGSLAIDIELPCPVQPLSRQNTEESSAGRTTTINWHPDARSWEHFRRVDRILRGRRRFDYCRKLTEGAERFSRTLPNS